jgi:hypothetical protein
LVIINGDASKILKQTQRNQLLKWLIPTIIASLALVISFLAYFHSMESNEISNRPFVAVIEANSFTWPTMRKNIPLKNLGAYIAIKNVGRTPAYKTEIKSAISIYGADFTDYPEYKDSAEQKQQVLINDKIYSIDVTSFREFTEKEINDVLDKKKFFYAYGEITYTDIFEEEHLTRFCFIRSEITSWTWTQIDKYSAVE